MSDDFRARRDAARQAARAREDTTWKSEMETLERHLAEESARLKARAERSATPMAAKSPGTVAGPPRPGPGAPPEARSPSAAPPAPTSSIDTSATAGMEMDAHGILRLLPSSTPSALPTTTSGPDSTASDSPSTGSAEVWSMSPIGYVSQAISENMIGPDGLAELPSPLRASLLALATGRNEPVEQTVWDICQYFVEEEDARAEGTVLDVVTFYVENYVYA